MQDTLTIVDTKEPVEMEIMNDHITSHDPEDSGDHSTNVQSLQEIPSVVHTDINPVYTTMSAVFQHSKNLVQVNSGQLDNVSKDIVQVNRGDLESVLSGAHGK